MSKDLRQTSSVSDESAKPKRSRARALWYFLQRKRSKLWYLLPVLLGLIGGVIGYIYFSKKDDSTKGENLGYTGYFLSILYVAVYIFFFPIHA